VGSECGICGKDVGDSYFVSDVGDVFCATHTDPRFCAGCRRVLPSVHQGVMCPGCLPGLLVHESQTERSRRNVLAWLTGHIGPNQFSTVPVTLADSHQFGTNQLGQTNWAFNGQRLDLGVQVLRNLTPNMFEHTLAHEYGHVLLVADPLTMRFMNGVPPERHVEEEGFCEVLKYLWLGECGTGHRALDQKNMRENPDPVYGDGFRMMWKRYEVVGSVMDLRAEMLGLVALSSRPRRPRLRNLLTRVKKEWSTPSGDASPGPHLVSPPAAPLEGGSHRPEREVHLRHRHRHSADSADTHEAQPRPMTTVNFTRPTAPTSPTVSESRSEPRPTREYRPRGGD